MKIGPCDSTDVYGNRISEKCTPKYKNDSFWTEDEIGHWPGTAKWEGSFKNAPEAYKYLIWIATATDWVSTPGSGGLPEEWGHPIT